MSQVTAGPDGAQRRAPTLTTLVAVSTVNPLAMSIYLPSLAGMVAAFSTTTSKVQMTMSLYLAAVAITQIFIGPLSDRYGRRPVIVWGMLIFVLGSIICVAAPTIEIMFLGRIIQAAGGCTGLIMARAIVRDLYNREQSASMIGYVTMGMTVGPMVGPAMGGLLDQRFGWQGGFYLMLGLGVIVFVLAWLDLHETNHNRQATGGFKGLVRSYRTLIGERQFLAYACTAMFTSSVYFSYLGGAPFISADVLGMEPAEIGLYFMFVAAGYIFGNWISGRFAASVGVIRMVITGSCLPAVSVALVAAAVYLGYYNPFALFLPMFFVGLGNGMCLPSAISGAVSVRPELAGAASALSASLQIGFGALTSTVVAWMLSETMFPSTVWPMIAVMACCIVLTAFSVFAAWMTERD